MVGTEFCRLLFFDMKLLNTSAWHLLLCSNTHPSIFSLLNKPSNHKEHGSKNASLRATWDSVLVFICTSVLRNHFDVSIIMSRIVWHRSVLYYKSFKQVSYDYSFPISLTIFPHNFQDWIIQLERLLPHSSLRSHWVLNCLLFPDNDVRCLLSNSINRNLNVRIVIWARHWHQRLSNHSSL
jgi:hypothetical protein